ncbi:MAG: metal-dependent phosphohydrolase, partial [Xanthobacteraceae bacterium]
MITLPELAAKALGSYLAEQLDRRFASTDPRLTKFIPHISKLALDCIGNSDALYHNVEHTMLVTQVGNEIMAGRARLMPTSANDYAHVIAACLLHDIGYVRGILKGD